METGNSRFFYFRAQVTPARLCLRFELSAPPPLHFPDPHSAGKIRENFQPVIADQVLAGSNCANCAIYSSPSGSVLSLGPMPLCKK